jgi:hypothetical protein
VIGARVSRSNGRRRVPSPEGADRGWRHHGAEADRIRGDLEELTAGPVLLNIRRAPGPEQTADDDAEP